jgi:ketosteroid isomerase-like protein
MADDSVEPMNPRIVAVLFSAVALLAGCTESDATRSKAEILAADKAFCASSTKNGPRVAFLAAIARDCKLLGDSRVGDDAVNSTFMQLPAAATLTWEPAFVDVSSSGDLGYTWGRYVLRFPTARPGVAPLIKMGTYVTIWKRQRGGAWKVELDGVNPDGSH